MRQVPSQIDYLIIGNGRLSHHLSFYFKSLNIPFSSWKRQDNSFESLKRLLQKSDYCLLCINDDEISNFYDKHQLQNTDFIHFSGALEIPGLFGFHPLMTFGQETYPLETYLQIPFIGSETKNTFQKVFPHLKNSYSQILPEQKGLYHSLCVLSGNGTTLLWDLVSKQFEQLGIKREALIPYLNQVTSNLTHESKGRWTGPWYRQDEKTINKHLQELDNTSLKNLYGELNVLSQHIGDQQ